MLQNKYKRINGRFVIVSDKNESLINSIKRFPVKKKNIIQETVNKEKVYIYGLFSPILNKYFYVGQTNDPEKRFYQHKLNKDNNIKKKYHINLLKKSKLSFKMDLFASIPVNLSIKWENAYIKHLKKLGHPLTNRESFLEIEADNILSEDDIDIIIALDDDPVSEKTIRDINFLSNIKET